MSSKVVSIYAYLRVRDEGVREMSTSEWPVHLPRESATVRAIARSNARTELTVACTISSTGRPM